MAGRPIGGYPPPAAGTVAMLRRASPDELPDGPDRKPEHPDAEVIYSDTSWRPLTVLAWRRYGGRLGSPDPLAERRGGLADARSAAYPAALGSGWV